MTLPIGRRKKGSVEGPVHSATFDQLSRQVGVELGHSSWVTVDQPTVDAFARVTRDESPIHVNASSVEALVFGGTIAHGFLTLSLIAAMAYEVCPSIRRTQTLNYGFDRVRFVAPVTVGSRVRARFTLVALAKEPAGWRARYEVTVDIEGKELPAVVCTWITAGIETNFDPETDFTSVQASDPLAKDA